MLDTSKFNGKEEVKVGKYLGTIGKHQLKINRVEAKIAQTGNPDFIFHVETQPVTNDGFEADATATNGGQVGKIAYGSYLKTEQQWDDFGKFLAILATKLGVKDVLDMKVNTVQTEDKVEYANQMAQVLTEVFSDTPYLWIRVVGEKYAYTKDGEPKTGTKLKFSKYGGFATIAEGQMHLKEVDPNNAYDLKPIPVENTSSAVTGGGVDY